MATSPVQMTWQPNTGSSCPQSQYLIQGPNYYQLRNQELSPVPQFVRQPETMLNSTYFDQTNGQPFVQLPTSMQPHAAATEQCDSPIRSQWPSPRFNMSNPCAFKPTNYPPQNYYISVQETDRQQPGYQEVQEAGPMQPRYFQESTNPAIQPMQLFPSMQPTQSIQDAYPTPLCLQMPPVQYDPTGLLCQFPTAAQFYQSGVFQTVAGQAPTAIMQIPDPIELFPLQTMQLTPPHWTFMAAVE